MPNEKHNLMIVVNDLGYFISHRLSIAIAAVNAGYSVHVAYGAVGKANESDSLLDPFHLYHLPIQRGRLNPFLDLLSVFSLWRLFRRVSPDLVHLVTIKPVLYGGIAARLARVPAVVSALAGLGFLSINQPGLKATFLRRLIKPLFTWALGHRHQKLIFQNTDDRDQVLSFMRVSLTQTQLTRGSGINLATCPLLPEPEGTTIVVMASRLLRDKGVLEFAAAANILHERGVKARFWLIGAPDLANPNSLTQFEVDSLQAQGVVEYLGYCSDVPSLYAKAHIVTLPSYYGEGFPKSLIEAAACGRAVVTTDMPGCRDAIVPDVSGLLIKARDPMALANALEKLIRDISLRKSMGKAGRKYAESGFDIGNVVDIHLQIYKSLLEPCEF